MGHILLLYKSSQLYHLLLHCNLNGTVPKIAELTKAICPYYDIIGQLYTFLANNWV